MDAKQYQAEYHEKHKDQLNTQCRKYYQENKEKLKERKRRYYQKHKEKIYEYQKKWCALHREHIRKRNKRWEQLNPEKRRKSANESYHRNKEKNRARRIKRASIWYYKNKDRILPIKKARYQKLVAELRAQIFSRYGAKCNCCGLDDIRFLSIDHVYCGKGNSSPAGDRHTLTFFKRIIAEEFPKDYQVLCMNCNWAKGVYKKCPHEQDKELGLGQSFCGGKSD